MSAYTVSAVFLKTEKGKPLVTPKDQTLDLVKGHGIKNDVNANAYSPRQVLLVSETTLTDLQLHHGNLRENVVISGSVDHISSGTLIAIGNRALLRVTFHCEVCNHLKEFCDIRLSDITGKRGVLAVVVQSGQITLGDLVQEKGKMYESLSDHPYERFTWLLGKIPARQVVTYQQLNTLIGGGQGFIRAIPGFVKRTLSGSFPLHKIVDTHGKLIRHIAGQREALEAEGIEVVNGKVDLVQYGWKPLGIYQ